MNAKIKLPNGPVAWMDDAGTWHCGENAAVAEYLNTISAGHSPLDFLPDQFERRVAAVLAATGAELLDRNVPPDNSPPGRIH